LDEFWPDKSVKKWNVHNAMACLLASKKEGSDNTYCSTKTPHVGRNKTQDVRRKRKNDSYAVPGNDLDFAKHTANLYTRERILLLLRRWRQQRQCPKTVLFWSGHESPLYNNRWLVGYTSWSCHRECAIYIYVYVWVYM